MSDAPTTDCDHYLIMTDEQEKFFKNRLDILIPTLRKIKLEYAEMDSCTSWLGDCGTYCAIAIIKNLPKDHIYPFWINLDTGTKEIGKNQFTAIIQLTYDSNIKDKLYSKGEKEVSRFYSSFWQSLMDKGNFSYENISQEIAEKIKTFGEKNFAVNHHLIYPKRQLPEEWFKKNNGDPYADKPVGLLNFLFT